MDHNSVFLSLFSGPALTQEADREAAGRYAYIGLSILSQRLDSRTCHYRTRSGQLLTTLDEVVRALEAGDLCLSQPSPI